jgi:hypothetical protein
MYQAISITMYLYIHITSYLPFYLSPTAKAGGASGSRAHPTFSACPAGQRRFAYTCGILYPPLNTKKAIFSIPGGIPGF